MYCLAPCHFFYVSCILRVYLAFCSLPHVPSSFSPALVSCLLTQDTEPTWHYSNLFSPTLLCSPTSTSLCRDGYAFFWICILKESVIYIGLLLIFFFLWEYGLNIVQNIVEFCHSISQIFLWISFSIQNLRLISFFFIFLFRIKVSVHLDHQMYCFFFKVMPLARCSTSLASCVLSWLLPLGAYLKLLFSCFLSLAFWHRH